RAARRTAAIPFGTGASASARLVGDFPWRVFQFLQRRADEYSLGQCAAAGLARERLCAQYFHPPPVRRRDLPSNRGPDRRSAEPPSRADSSGGSDRSGRRFLALGHTLLGPRHATRAGVIENRRAARRAGGGVKRIVM